MEITEIKIDPGPPVQLSAAAFADVFITLNRSAQFLDATMRAEEVDYSELIAIEVALIQTRQLLEPLLADNDYLKSTIFMPPEGLTLDLVRHQRNPTILSSFFTLKFEGDKTAH